MAEQLEESDIADIVYRDWLTARRLENQRTSFLLHSLIKTHALQIGESESLVRTTRGLVGAASSLWRAVCLSDRLAVYEDFEEDEFCLTDRVIENDFIAETSDRASPDWSFFSHMSKARASFVRISMAPELSLLSRADIPDWVGLSYKECWIRHQALLDRAIERFGAILDR